LAYLAWTASGLQITPNSVPPPLHTVRSREEERRKDERISETRLNIALQKLNDIILYKKIGNLTLAE
jgi:hypothetical protein